MGNIRKTDSKKRILKAFIEILNTDGFNKMTVSKITSLAHINSDLKNSIQEQLANLLKNIFTENNANINNPKIAQPYASNIIFGSISTIFITWIKNNMQESPEELLNIINSYRKLTPIDIFS